MMINLSHLSSLPLFMSGPPLEEGPLPAFFYFALSAEESLALAPYNTPITLLSKERIRCFSFTLPGHGEGFDKHAAMKYWCQHLQKEPLFLEKFLDEIAQSIESLCQREELISKSAIGGLSRGGWVATQLAARLPHVGTLVAFAPLTRLVTIEEFRSLNAPLFLQSMERYDLAHLSPHLLHLHHLKFHISNRDTRVSTDACYSFIRSLSDHAHDQHIRSLKSELHIYPAIGHKGHGTPPEIFREGTEWLKKHLLS